MVKKITILGPSGNVVATAAVENKASHYEGVVELSDAPMSILSLFEEFERIVDGQTLSLLDGIEARVREAGLTVDFGCGRRTPVSDMQIFPSTRAITFRVNP